MGWWPEHWVMLWEWEQEHGTQRVLASRWQYFPSWCLSSSLRAFPLLAALAFFIVKVISLTLNLFLQSKIAFMLNILFLLFNLRFFFFFYSSTMGRTHLRTTNQEWVSVSSEEWQVSGPSLCPNHIGYVVNTWIWWYIFWKNIWHFVIITTYKNQNLDLLPEFISMKKNQTYGERIMHRVYQR